MHKLKFWLAAAVLAVAVSVPLSFATWPTVDVTTTALDADSDSPLAARPQLYDLATKFNQVRAHVSTFIATLLDDADAAAARNTLGLGTAATAATGTSGATVPLLNGANTWSAAQTFAGLSATTGAFSGTVSSTKACASGYTRVLPNYCAKDVLSVSGNVTTTCTKFGYPLGITDAKSLYIRVESYIRSTNSVGLRETTVNVYAPTDTTCTGTITDYIREFSYEYVAVAAGTTIARSNSTLIVRSASTGDFYLKIGGAGTGLALVYYLGYFD